MRALCFVTLLTLASHGLAGCAVNATEQAPDTTDTTEAAITVADRAPAELAAMQAGVGGRAGVTIAGGYERRMYDFTNVPRIAEREPYEVNLTALENALVVPHTGTIEGKEIAWHPGTDCGVTCAAP